MSNRSITEKVPLALGFLGLLIMFSGICWGDAITFGFVGVRTTLPVAVNNTGVTLSSAPLLPFTGSNTNNGFIVPGTVNISTGAASPTAQASVHGDKKE